MEIFDLVIIGGGIHGAGVAQAAAAAGYSVQMLEQADKLAQGTSSRSSKLIHGGLRYLETGQLALVRECLKERATLLRIAPELVKLQAFHIPIYQHSLRRPWQLHCGLSLYALLSGLDKSGYYKSLPRTQWQHLDGLNTQGLQAVFRYYDAQTDDVALTHAVMKSALSLGAKLQLSASVRTIELGSPNRIIYQQDGQTKTCQCRIVINAAGPWVNKILDQVQPTPPRQAMEWVQGTHIEIEGQLLKGFYYLEAREDQRAVFAMPWQGHILIGTTETHYQGDPAAVTPLIKEQDYLLETFKYYFKDFHHLNRKHIINSFAGLRVLPSSNNKAHKRARETILLSDAEKKILTIYGGKLTAYRSTSEKIIRQLKKHLPHRKKIADTQQLFLHD